MATSKIAVTEGSGKNVATNSFSEDAVTKEVGRQVLNNSSGTEVGTSSTPLEVNLRSSTVGVATSAKQDTGNTSLSSIDGKITAVNTGAVTVASSALPSGAATSAKQPALGTAGTASADVITVQGKASMTPVLTDGSATTQPVSGTVTTTPPSNASSNVAQLAGTTTDTNSGSKSAGTLRVVLATDQPALTNKLLVTPDSVALPANQSVNTAQIAGTTTDTNSGTKSAGTQRIVLATDQPQLTNALKVDGSAVTQPVSGTVTIGTSVTPGTAATNLGKAEDGAHTSGDVGVMSLGVRNDTRASLAGTDLDYAPPQFNSSGDMRTETSSVGGTAVNASPAGFQRVTDEPSQIFYDPFDAALDTTNRWTAPTTGNSAVAATVTTGVMSMGTGTTASGWSKLTSQASFVPTIPGWITHSFALALPDGAAPIANSYRFWGAGTIATTPTTAAPMTDAVGFEVSTAGKMSAVVFQAGTRVSVQDLSAATGNSKQPTDASNHRYIIQYRTDKTYFYIDGLGAANLAATADFISPNVQTLPQSFVAVGGATPPVSNVQIQCAGAVVSDTAKNNTQLSDGTYPWRKVTVTAAGAIVVDDLAAAPTAASVPSNAQYTGLLAQTANPSAASAGNLVGALSDKVGKQVVVNSIRDLKGVQQTTITSSTSETTIVTAVASTFLDLYGLTITNTSATVTKVTIKDDTAGTTRAVIEIPATETRGFMLTESAAIPQAVVNKPWTATCGTSVAAIEITALYVKNT